MSATVQEHGGIKSPLRGQCARYLRDKGTPLAVAQEKGRQPFVDLLLKHGGHA
jgi:hypothetical protein